MDMVQKRPEYDPVLTAGPRYIDYFHHDGCVEKKAVYDDRKLIAKFGLITFFFFFFLFDSMDLRATSSLVLRCTGNIRLPLCVVRSCRESLL